MQRHYRISRSCIVSDVIGVKLCPVMLLDEIQHVRRGGQSW